MEMIRQWLRRHFTNPQVVYLVLLLAFGLVAVVFFGRILGPLFAALVIAYLLDGMIEWMSGHRIPRPLALASVFGSFVLLMIFGFILWLPSMVGQLDRFIRSDLPRIMRIVTDNLEQLETRYEQFKTIRFGRDTEDSDSSEGEPGRVGVDDEAMMNGELALDPGSDPDGGVMPEVMVGPPPAEPSEADIDARSPPPISENPSWAVALLERELSDLGKRILLSSVNSLRNFMTWLTYLILVPFLVFFMLHDKEKIQNWLGRFLPKDNALAERVWSEVNQQIANYVRGKFWEMVIVWGVTFVALKLFDLRFALVVSFFVGLSVLIPYVGAIAMFFPVAILGLYQFDWGGQLLWLCVTYIVIQALDGNVLAPLLLSKVTNLHPVAIIVAILVFGGLWGFWGIFFAIPLATLVNSVIQAWPSATGASTTPVAPKPAVSSTG